jgi:hypothetical protein
LVENNAKDILAIEMVIDDDGAGGAGTARDQAA